MRTATLAAAVILVLTSSAGLAQTAQPTGQSGTRAIKAARLPRHAQEVRSKGVPDAEVRKALKAAREKRVPAGEMSDVVGEHSRAVDDHGPIDNFGAFVQGKLDQGLRGRELSDAIRAEHAKRGKGKGAKLDKADGPRSPDKEKEKADRRREDNAQDAKKASRDAQRDKDKQQREQAERERERADKAAKEAKVRAEKANKNTSKPRGKP